MNEFKICRPNDIAQELKDDSVAISEADSKIKKVYDDISEMQGVVGKIKDLLISNIPKEEEDCNNNPLPTIPEALKEPVSFR